MEYINSQIFFFSFLKLAYRPGLYHMANAMKPQRQLVQSNERQHTDAREAAVVPMPRKKGKEIT